MCKSNENGKVTCPRCGGSGKTEFTHVVEGVCFMCNGFGMVYPKRVKELTERATKRKATIQKKIDEKNKIAREKQEELEKRFEKWVYQKNLIYYKNFDKVTKSSEYLIDRMESMSKHLNFNENTPESVVRGFIDDYFKPDRHFRFQVSKWTEKKFGFIWMEIYKDSYIWDNDPNAWRDFHDELAQ